MAGEVVAFEFSPESAKLRIRLEGPAQIMGT